MGKRWNNKIEIDGFVPFFFVSRWAKSQEYKEQKCMYPQFTSVLVNLKSRQQLDFEMKYACKLQESIFKSSRLKTDNVQA